MKALRLLIGSAAMVTALLMTGTAHAGAVGYDTWYSFSWSGSPPNPTTGGSFYGMADPGGSIWTYTAPTTSYVTITDLEADIDYFSLFDGATLVGTTPVSGVATGSCGGDPDACIAAGYSSATFALAAGSHSLSITEVDFSSGGRGAFRIDVPEPGTLLLFAAGLLGLSWKRRSSAS